MKKTLQLHIFQIIRARNMFLLFDSTAMCYFRHCELSSELKFSAKTVQFVEITRQTFCSYPVAFLFSKAMKFDFLLWLFRPTQKDIFSFLVFHFSVKNWNYCRASIKETGRSAKHVILWRYTISSYGPNDISEVQRSLPNLRYKEFSGGVLKCECTYNPAWVTPRHARA